MEPSTISIKGLSKRFGKNHVLRDVELQIPAGCVYALLGENGAGKTTLIRILMGYVKPNSGSVSVLGISPQNDPFALRRRVGYVSDLPGLYEWMTVKQIAWFCSAFYSSSYSEHFARWARPGLGVMRDVQNARILEQRTVKARCFFRLGVKPQVRDDLLHGTFSSHSYTAPCQ